VIRRLLLVRHGVTTWNREGRFQGHLDPPLDPLGVLEARALAERLVREEQGPLLLASSPLRRAAATAAVIADALAGDGVAGEVLLDPGLMEIGQGEWEGRTHAELAAEDAERYRAWASSGGMAQPPGAEPLASAAERATAAVRALVGSLDGEGGSASLCCVSHGGILRLVAARLTGMPEHEALEMDVDNASLSVLERADGAWRIERWNDTAHLSPEQLADERQQEGTPRAL
jgi:probable phosphoglycerate mutase